MEKWFFRGLQHYITFELRHDLKKVAILDPPPSVDFVEFVFQSTYNSILNGLSESFNAKQLR